MLLFEVGETRSVEAARTAVVECRGLHDVGCFMSPCTLGPIMCSAKLWPTCPLETTDSVGVRQRLGGRRQARSVDAASTTTLPRASVQVFIVAVSTNDAPARLPRLFGWTVDFVRRTFAGRDR